MEICGKLVWVPKKLGGKFVWGCVFGKLVKSWFQEIGEKIMANWLGSEKK